MLLLLSSFLLADYHGLALHVGYWVVTLVLGVVLCRSNLLTASLRPVLYSILFSLSSYTPSLSIPCSIAALQFVPWVVAVVLGGSLLLWPPRCILPSSTSSRMSLIVFSPPSYLSMSLYLYHADSVAKPPLRKVRASPPATRQPSKRSCKVSLAIELKICKRKRDIQPRMSAH